MRAMRFFARHRSQSKRSRCSRRKLPRWTTSRESCATRLTASLCKRSTPVSSPATVWRRKNSAACSSIPSWTRSAGGFPRRTRRSSATASATRSWITASDLNNSILAKKFPSTAFWQSPRAALSRAAARARQRPEFLARVLARYQDIEGLTATRFREYLGVTVANWPRLELCLRPRGDAFLNDVTQIAQAFGIERTVLAAVIRRVDAIEVVQRQAQAGRAGTLLAARTRKRSAARDCRAGLSSGLRRGSRPDP